MNQPLDTTTTTTTTAAAAAGRTARGRRRTAALAVLLTTALGAGALPQDVASAAATERGQAATSFEDLNSRQLWRAIEGSGGRAVVGLKDDEDLHGFADGRSWVDAAERAEAEAAVLALAGVRRLAADAIRPTVTVEVAGAGAVAALRASAHVDYVEPATLDLAVHSDGGCTGNPWNTDAEGGDTFTGPFDRAQLTSTTSDLVPRHFASARVQEAWGRSPAGAGVTVGVLDTGVFNEQTQLHTGSGGRFASGASAGRTVRHLDFSRTGESFDACNHGTRSAGSIAAPRDGSSMVGLAYRANLVTAKVGHDVIVDSAESGYIVEGIRGAVASGAKIISMAIGTTNDYRNVSDEIDLQHTRGVLFVAAAGTTYCLEGVIFPARHPRAVAVTATNSQGRLHSSACRGPEVDIAANIDDASSLGRHGWDKITWGGSSAATSVAAGTAALIWSKYPSMTRDQVRDRLVWAGKGAVEGGLGNGAIDAYKAVGGLYRLSITGGGSIEPRTTTTLTASPAGDGPFTYQWSTGQTTPSITVTSGMAGSSRSYTVHVTDGVDGRVTSRTVTVTASSPTDEVCFYKAC